MTSQYKVWARVGDLRFPVIPIAYDPVEWDGRHWGRPDDMGLLRWAARVQHETGAAVLDAYSKERRTGRRVGCYGAPR